MIELVDTSSKLRSTPSNVSVFILYRVRKRQLSFSLFSKVLQTSSERPARLYYFLPSLIFVF